MKTVVWITTTFPAHHRWIDAPDEVAFLRSWHRHIFHVKLGVEVSHQNRQVEFFILKKEVEDFISVNFHNKRFEWACEQIAASLLREFKASSVSVSEDLENGATVYADSHISPE